MAKRAPQPVEPALTTIAATKFKATCLDLMDEVARTGRELVVTKHGRPVVRISAAAQATTSPFGFMKGMFTIHGDIVSSIHGPWEMSPSDPLWSPRMRKR